MSATQRSQKETRAPPPVKKQRITGHLATSLAPPISSKESPRQLGPWTHSACGERRMEGSQEGHVSREPPWGCVGQGPIHPVCGTVCPLASPQTSSSSAVGSRLAIFVGHSCDDPVLIWGPCVWLLCGEAPGWQCHPVSLCRCFRQMWTRLHGTSGLWPCRLLLGGGRSCVFGDVIPVA